MARRPPVGALRPSQLIHTFGVGAVVDLPNVSALIVGVEDWDAAVARPIVEDRLLAAVRAQLGPQVERLVAPPVAAEDAGVFFTPSDRATERGVPVKPFPRYLRCPACDRLGPRYRGIFDLRIDPYRPDRTRYVHTNCQRAKAPAVLPARFVVACSRGHLDEFPWVSYVHARTGNADCAGTLVLREIGVSAEASDVLVECRACGEKRVMADAFGEQGLEGYKCRGRRPHLHDFDDKMCDERPRAILLGASSSWFPVALSTLYVPPAPGDKLAVLVDERWALLSAANAANVVAAFRTLGQLGELTRYSDDAIWKAIESRREGGLSDRPGDLKAPEWRVFTAPESSPQTADFRLVPVPPPPSFAQQVRRVILVERLREVTALTGFTRIVSSLDYDGATAVPSDRRAPLSRQPPTIVPAAEVRGEGIFIELNEAVLARWCASQTAREAELFEAHRRWRVKRQIEPPDAGFPGIRYVLLHSLAHALMRQLALECGYAAASLRERIYSASGDREGGPMAGILIYTAAPDSEGTLGGLVRLGRPDQLDRHLGQAFEHVRLCASDPLCAEHDPTADSGTTLHGAACHACLFAPETSCERGNRYLDRLALVTTVRGAEGALFEDR